MASIKDVAREAGVSVATVSRVINKSGIVTEETRKIVTDAIEKLNYRTNLFGKGLRRGETKIIMVMLSSLANTFCSSVIRSIDKCAGAKGYYTMICTTDGIKEKEEYYINFALNGLFDGIIVLNSSLSEKRMAQLSKQIPTVQCNEVADSVSTPYVTIDNELAAYDAVNYLVSHGRRRVALFTVDNTLLSTVERTKGYRKALKKNGIDYDDRLVIFGNYGYRNAVDVFAEFMKSKVRFDAVFAISDRMAAGAMCVLLENKYRIPADAEVIGFDNTDISYTTNPRITTISQPHSQLGINAFEQLENQIQNKKTKNIILTHKLVERESTL